LTNKEIRSIATFSTGTKIAGNIEIEKYLLSHVR